MHTHKITNFAQARVGNIASHAQLSDLVRRLKPLRTSLGGRLSSHPQNKALARLYDAVCDRLIAAQMAAEKEARR